MFLVPACSCLCTIYWSQVLSGEWRCSWSSADRRCSNYIWVINNSIAYESASYIRDLMVHGSHFAVLCCGLVPVNFTPYPSGLPNQHELWPTLVSHPALHQYFNQLFNDKFSDMPDWNLLVCLQSPLLISQMDGDIFVKPNRAISLCYFVVMIDCRATWHGIINYSANSCDILLQSPDFFQLESLFSHMMPCIWHHATWSTLVQVMAWCL